MKEYAPQKSEPLKRVVKTLTHGLSEKVHSLLIKISDIFIKNPRRFNIPLSCDLDGFIPPGEVIRQRIIRAIKQ
ncbi:hypothetical protein HY025_00140 [Candidatus Daviesbacteria bacterium]|nr:hypothetical protein [Candidatus Daviesbacteria bacterium]